MQKEALTQLRPAKDTPALRNKHCAQSLCRALGVQEGLNHCIVCSAGAYAVQILCESLCDHAILGVEPACDASSVA